MKPNEAMVFDKISSDGDSGFRDDFSESVSSGSQRGMTPQNETWRGSKEPQGESGFNWLPHKTKHASSRGGLPTIFTHNKKSGQIKESFIQKTKRKLFRKAKKGSAKAKESKEFQSKSKGIKHEDGHCGKNVTEEKLIDFPGVVRERRIGSATMERDESAGAASIKTTRVENKYCSTTPKTNCGEIHTFVTRPRSMLRVMYDFRAREENDVSVKRGEMVTVLNKDDQDWWWVENSKLQQGFVPQKYIWPCACYDATWRDIISGLSYAVSKFDRKKLQNDVEDLFGGSNKCMVFVSVRSALDNFLTVMNFPKGSEIIFTAINIPDMVSVVEKHGLIIIPVDIDVETLAPNPELLELAVTSRTVAILAAHLYGKWVNFDRVCEIAEHHGLHVLEDCAECFQGCNHRGNKNADLSFFSFGSIKYYTSLGGAVVQVRDTTILSKMRALFDTYPIQSHWVFFKKLIKYSCIMSVLNNPINLGIGLKFVHFINVPYMEYFINFIRAFPDGMVLEDLRYQPSAYLLQFMVYRLTKVDDDHFAVVKMKGDFVRQNMPKNVFVPGQKADIVNYWLFPILVDDPEEVTAALLKEGIESYKGATQLRTILRSKTQSMHVTTADKAAESGKGLKASINPGLQTVPELAAALGHNSPVTDVPHPRQTISTPRYFCGSLGESTNHSPDVEKANKLVSEKDFLFPYNAKYLIDHVLYLPVHKRAPLWFLEKVCLAVEKVMKGRIGVKLQTDKTFVLFPSKL